MTTDSPLRYTEIADRVATRPTGGAHRRACDPIVGGTPRGGAHRAEGSVDGLLLEAFEAAALLSTAGETWSSEQILVHPEIAELAADEARRDLAAAGKPRRRRGRRNRDADPVEEKRAAVDLAQQILTEAHTRLTFLDA